MLHTYIGRIAAGDNLSADDMTSAVDAMMTEGFAEGEIGVFLTALNAKGETVEELVGAARLRRHMLPIHTKRTGLIDTCGPGGDGSGTFNISTAAAIVTAAAGVPVAKHGNRKVTSRTGSADVLAALGVNIECDVATVERCLDEVGLCFCFAAALHPAMKRLAEVRRKLGVRTIFNLLGPLSNPAGAPFQLMGVPSDGLRAKMAAALAQLGIQRALVVHGEDGLDEVTVSGRTFVSEVAADSRGIREYVWTPADFGLRESSKETLLAADAGESAAIIRDVLANRSGPARDIVVANAAAALFTAGSGPTLIDAAARAGEAIASGAAATLLGRSAQVSQGR